MRKPVSIWLTLDAHDVGTIEVCAHKDGVTVAIKMEHCDSSAVAYMTRSEAVGFLTKAINLIVDECVP